VEQLPPEQVLQLDPEPAGEPPLDLTAKVLNSLATLSLVQDGHATRSFPERMNTSNTERHSLQKYSYMGILILSPQYKKSQRKRKYLFSIPLAH
jgi:hypothetical protein